MHKKKISTMLIGVLTISILTGCSQTKGSDVQNISNQKEIQVTKGDIKEEISLSGSIKADKLTNVSGVSGTIEEIYVSSNEDVLEGEDIILLTNGKVIEAPFDGKITKISVSEGDNISSSTNVFNIASKDAFNISAYVDESEITKVKVGQKVNVTVSAIDKELTGTITSVDGEATSSGNSTSFGIVITLEGDFENVYSGMSSEMTITINESLDTLLVPVEAVKNIRGTYMVSIKDGDSIKDVEVEVGLQNSSMVEIKSGISANDTIVYTQEVKTNSFGSDMKGNNRERGDGGMPGGNMPYMPAGGQMPSGGQMPGGQSR
ncbi:MAG: HlyD family efflux transporter periplasmic adaptor subunit [Romboutsia sp.]|nr:HlyD family efflux transporter periplasmic adaptor subunit [Romboutsia sp.]